MVPLNKIKNRTPPKYQKNTKIRIARAQAPTRDKQEELIIGVLTKNINMKRFVIGSHYVYKILEVVVHKKFGLFDHNWQNRRK